MSCNLAITDKKSEKFWALMRFKPCILGNSWSVIQIELPSNMLEARKFGEGSSFKMANFGGCLVPNSPNYLSSSWKYVKFWVEYMHDMLGANKLKIDHLIKWQTLEVA